MSSYYEDLGSLYQNIDQDFTDDEIEFAKQILEEYVTVMFYEGYSHKAVRNFLENVDSVEDILDKINSSNIIEGNVSEDYIQEQLDCLEEGWVRGAIGALGRLIKRKPKQLELPLRTKGGMRPANTPIRNKIDDAVSGVKSGAQKLKNIPKPVKDVAKVSTGVVAGAATVSGLSGKGGKDKKSDGPSSSTSTSGASTSTKRTNKDGSSVTRTGKNDAGLTPMQQWAKNYPKLAAKVKPGQSGYSDIQKLKSTEKKPVKEAYDYVLEYLLQTGQAETVSEACHIMLSMDDKSTYEIVKEMVQE